MSSEKMSRQQRWIIVGLIVLGAVLVLWAAVWPQIRSAAQPTAVASAVSEIIAITPTSLPEASGLSVGDPGATVTIDVFEDFQCPACQYFTQTIETRIIASLVTPGKARYVFHNYPFLDDRVPEGQEHESDQAASASMCANEQGKFWAMHDTLYANWNGENQGAFSALRLQAMAKSIGLDMDAFQACFSANKYQADVQADFELGKQMGVDGTPSVFVNGSKVGQPGRIATYDEIAQAVEQALNK